MRPGEKVQRHGSRMPSGGGVGPPFRGVPGRPTFVLQTDHRALEHLLTAKLVNKRLSRWALRLQGFSFTIVYRLGTANANADTLSRQDWPTDAGSTCDSDRLRTALTRTCWAPMDNHSLSRVRLPRLPYKKGSAELVSEFPRFCDLCVHGILLSLYQLFVCHLLSV